MAEDPHAGRQDVTHHRGHRHLADGDGNHWQDAQCHVSGVRRALGHGKVAGGGVTIYSASEDSFVAEVTRPRTILCHLLPFERFAQLLELSVCLPTNLRELLY